MEDVNASTNLFVEKEMLTPPVTPPRLKTVRTVREDSYLLNALIVKGAFVLTITSVIYWAWVALNISLGKNLINEETHPNYKSYQHRLSEGWIFGRKVDNSDSQYAGIRNKLFILVLVLIGQMLVTNVLSYLFGSHGYKKIGPNNSKSLSIRQTWSLLFSCAFLLILIGASFIKVLILVSIAYGISYSLGTKKSGIVLVWGYCILILFLNYWFQGYRFESLHSSLKWLDKLQGVGFRWYVVFNFTILRVISFSMDRYWATSKNEGQFSVKYLNKKHVLDCTECDVVSGTYCLKGSTEKSLEVNRYNYLNYLLYLLYAPLYLAGPIISFNNFMHQISATYTVDFKQLLLYAMRWLGMVALMEGMLHSFYVVAIKDEKSNPVLTFSLGRLFID